MRIVLISLLLLLLSATSAHARQVHWANRGAAERQAKRRKVIAQMLANIAASRRGQAQQRAAKDPRVLVKKKRLEALREAQQQRTKRLEAERRKRFLEKVATQPKPVHDEYKIYQIRKKHGWLPQDDFAKWRESTEYHLFKKALAKRKEPDKKPTIEEMDAVMKDILTGRRRAPKKERKPELEEEEEEDE